jgi:hypothetical protein
MDAHADAGLTHAEFRAEGMILRGGITVAPRRPIVNGFVKTEAEDGFTAYESWIPGGTITDLRWSWTWMNNQGQPGGANFDDRFLLRRPWGSARTTFGLVVDLSRPLPGLDGWGQVCLDLVGTRVDPVSGALANVQTGKKCTRFGLDLGIVFERPGNRLFMREYVAVPPEPWRPPRPEDPLREAALVEVGAPRSHLASSNTLVVYLDDADPAETVATLRDGLEACRRVDGGLLVLVLVRDGELSAAPHLGHDLQELTSGLPAQTIVNEDARGSWSETFGLLVGSGEPSWRLIAPTGGVTWIAEGRIGGEELGLALDEYLLPSRPPAISYVHPGLELGAWVPPFHLDPSLGDLYARPCPPPPLGSLGLVAFVQHGGSDASEATVAGLVGATRDGDSRVAAVVVDGVEDERLFDVRELLGDAVVVIGDPAGVVASRFGVRLWPTTVTLDERGRTIGFDMGWAPPGGEPAEPSKEAE